MSKNTRTIILARAVVENYNLQSYHILSSVSDKCSSDMNMNTQHGSTLL